MPTFEKQYLSNGWILDFQYCKLVLDFLRYFFNVK